MPGIPSVGSPVPVCPMCDGPCQHDFERSALRFPDRLPVANTTRPDGVAAPVPAPKVNRRGKRAVHGPDEDRAIHGPTDTTSAGPLVEDRSR